MTSRMKAVVMVVALAWAAPASASIDNAGTTAGNFLSVGAGASVLGMGGATLALPNGLVGAAWNPAALARLDPIELVVSHAGLANQTSQEWVGVGGRFATTSMHWAITGLYHGQGRFQGRDATGVSTGTFGVSDMALGAHVARQFGPAVSVGLGTKYVSEVLDNVSGAGITFDGGVLVRAGFVGLGVAAQNVGGRMRYAGPSFPFPSNVGVGAALDLPSGLRVAVDANFPQAYYNDVRAGLEWRWKGLLAVRAGYRHELAAPVDDPLSGPSFGLGGGVGSVWFDYGYVVPGQGDGQHRIGVTLRPASMRGMMRPLGAQPVPAEPVATATGGAKQTPAATPTADPAPRPTETAAASQPRAQDAPPSVTAAPIAPVAAVAPASVAPPPPARQSARVKPAASAPKTAPAVAPVAASETISPVPAQLAPVKSAPVPATPAPVKSDPAPATMASVPAKPAVTAAPAPAKPSVPAAAQQLATLTPSEPVRAPKLVEPAPAVIPVPKAVAAPKPVLPEPTPERAPVAATRPATVVASIAPRLVPTPASSAPTRPGESLVIQRPAKVRIKGGETLADIAKRWGVTVPAIMMENNMVSERVKNGQEIRLPSK